jgi:hypothetical protein
MTDARSGRAHPGARGDGAKPPSRSAGAGPERHPVASFLRANPQVFILLLICVVLGLGTFLAVLFGLLTTTSGQTTGEPSGAILGAHAALSAARELGLYL